MTTLEDLQAFDVANADVTVWTVRKSGGLKDAPPVFTARWVSTDAALDTALKAAVDAARVPIAEIRDYGLLAQNNEGSALAITVAETHAPRVVQACADPTADRKVTGAGDLNNSDFYVIKLVGDGHTLLALRKTDSSWRSKKTAFNPVTAIFQDQVLTLDTQPRFALSPTIDFFIVADEILVLDKGNFESILNYKQTHVDDFAALQLDPEFVVIFTALDDLTAYIGSNKIQLRRASAIKALGYYKDAGFMERLRAEAAALHLSIVFGADGKIQPTPASCRDIVQALLDHRLDSRLSRNVYDVDDAAVV
jgi:hypothetical protein